MRTSCDALSTFDGRRIHFAVMAIESAARKLGVSSREMHDRLKAQDLIRKRLLGRYEVLHTQSREWVADDIGRYSPAYATGRELRENCSIVKIGNIHRPKVALQSKVVTGNVTAKG